MRETQDGKPAYIIEKQKIGVTGMSRGAGVTFVATSLAKALSSLEERRVTVLETRDCLSMTKALIYDSIGIDKRFKTREFVRFYDEVRQGAGVRGKSNPDEKINWGLVTPEDVRDGIELTPIEMIRLINNISGDFIICDISDCKNAADYLIDMDTVIFVIDPSPSCMIAGYPFMREVKRMEFKGKKIIWLINKYNSGINKRDLLNFLKIKEYYKIPFIAADNFYSAEYNCKIPCETPGARDGVGEVMERIVKILSANS